MTAHNLTPLPSLFFIFSLVENGKVSVISIAILVRTDDRESDEK